MYMETLPTLPQNIPVAKHRLRPVSSQPQANEIQSINCASNIIAKSDLHRGDKTGRYRQVHNFSARQAPKSSNTRKHSRGGSQGFSSQQSLGVKISKDRQALL